jgi:hypothetical protein
MSETVQRRYYTKAAEYYRHKLRELSENRSIRIDVVIDFTQFSDAPSYEEGRVWLQTYQPRITES